MDFHIKPSEAEGLIYEYLSDPAHYPDHDFDFFFDTFAEWHTNKIIQANPQIKQAYRRVEGFRNEYKAANSDVFANSLWSLAKRGFLRPGKARYSSGSGSGSDYGYCYCLTDLGKEWLESEDDLFIVISNHALANQLAMHNDRFGKVYAMRSQEAIKCFQSMAYLGCCAMCGAAFESILIVTAIEKTKDEKEIIKMIRGRNGTRRVWKELAEEISWLSRQFESSYSLVKYWRDISSHGEDPYEVTSNEANISIRQLIQFSKLVDDNWETLTAKAG